MDVWVNHCTQQRGPSVNRILEKGIPVFPKLASLAVDSTIEFYDKLQKTSALFLLPLMLFDSINLHMGFKGLCPLGLGLPWYAKIATVLMEVLPCLLPDVDSQVTSLVTVVRVESNNGYDLLWWVLELIVMGVDASLQLSAPVWMGDDIFNFCLLFLLYFRVQLKRGLDHDNCTKSLTFLQVVWEPAYVDVITTLQAHIVMYQAPDFGYLPPNLCLMGLAAQMNKNAKAQVWDVMPQARQLVWQPDEWRYLAPGIQGYNVPQLYCMDVSRACPQDDGWNRNCMPDHGHDDRRDPYRRNACDNGQDASRRPDWFGLERMGGPGRNGSRGQYTCPDHNHCTWDPDITCAACKRRSHPAANCDMIAMALFLDKYVKGTMLHLD
jgi:hypothetical protein